MTQWTSNNIHKGMQVYSAENEDLGHIEKAYDDSFLVQKGLLFHKDRYIPYSVISTIDEENVHLMVSKAEAREMRWDQRPSEHTGDTLQTFYDHGTDLDNPLNTHRA
ncbi:DUF2171 domain-containing protein [Ktedonobacter racemifer]|uniref:PRC-barrel domain-containing protein n=1 Tax=Ktedonobacter racemifer DSM 44963 TaxID=485913 RepID=D6TG59_KTERA|nr:DUF2171 domain-containing protein [Ktedonobacter racemifer]EFH88761.1 hypothetical protein Krac_10259 [Ktedonobacter racemifer DSM 44963]